MKIGKKVISLLMTGVLLGGLCAGCSPVKEGTKEQKKDPAAAQGAEPAAGCDRLVWHRRRQYTVSDRTGLFLPNLYEYRTRHLPGAGGKLARRADAGR